MVLNQGKIYLLKIRIKVIFNRESTTAEWLKSLNCGRRRVEDGISNRRKFPRLKQLRIGTFPISQPVLRKSPAAVHAISLHHFSDNNLGTRTTEVRKL